MTVASGIIRKIALVPESVYGTTPTTPTFVEIRVKPGSGLSAAKKTELIRQVNEHGNPIELLELGQDVSGQYDLVWSPGGAFDTILAASLKGAWSTNTLWNGRTLAPMTFEEKITGTAANYHRFTGCEIESLSFTATAREALQASISLQGKQAAIATSIVTGATYTAPTTSDHLTSLSVASLSLIGLVTPPSVRQITGRIQHSLTPIEVVGNKYRTGHVADQISVNGNVETLFESKEAYDAFLNHSFGSLAFTIGAEANNKYTITFPKVRFSEGSISAPGPGPVMASFAFEALYDGTNGTIKIDKAVA